MRRPCCVKDRVRRGTWTPEEDKILIDFIRENGHVTWQELPELAGLSLLPSSFSSSSLIM